MTAKTVVDVILGEAKAGSYQDMLAIASVISNRAIGAGTSWQDVVSRTAEFNAYNKPLPSGVNNHRAMAQKAVDEVKQRGPVHNATFYATPKAKRNLPKGLEAVTSTDGHEYFTDPQKRPIYTGSGLKSIDYRQVNIAKPQVAYNDLGLPNGNEAPVPANVSIPAPVGNGLGLANLVDGNRNRSAVSYANQSATRNQSLSPSLNSIMEQATATASKMHGMEITPIVSSGGQFSSADLKSGFEGGRVGSTRHDDGGAGDMQFKADGKLLDMRNKNDRSVLSTIIEESVALGATGVGGAPNYMGTNTLHIGYGEPATWGKTGEPASKFVSEAWERGRSRFDPDKPLHVDVPTPQPRSSSQTNAAPRGTIERENLGPASITPAPSGKVEQLSLGPIVQPSKEAFAPKASDYANYQMNVKQPSLPVGNAIPKPAARVKDFSSVVSTPATRPKDLTNAIPTPVTRPKDLVSGPAGVPIPAPTLQRDQPSLLDKGKQKIGDHLKEQLNPKTLGARAGGALVLGSLLGPVGMQIGAQIGPSIAKSLKNKKPSGLLSILNRSNNVPIPTNRNMSSSSSQWGSAQNQGATYTASDGATITGNGNGTYSRTNPKTGGVSNWNADGSRSTKGY